MVERLYSCPSAISHLIYLPSIGHKTSLCLKAQFFDKFIKNVKIIRSANLISLFYYFFLLQLAYLVAFYQQPCFIVYYFNSIRKKRTKYFTQRVSYLVRKREMFSHRYSLFECLVCSRRGRCLFVCLFTCCFYFFFYPKVIFPIFGNAVQPDQINYCDGRMSFLFLFSFLFFLETMNHFYSIYGLINFSEKMN